MTEAEDTGQERSGTDSRQTVDQLHQRVDSGEPVHSVIHSTLQNDVRLIHQMFQGEIPDDVPEDMLKLYGVDKATMISLPFFDGASYVVSRIYDAVESAAKPEQEKEAVEKNPALESMLRRMDPSLQDEIAKAVQTKVSFGEIVQGDLREELTHDPSGLSYMQKRIDETFPPEDSGRVGAQAALGAIKTLYNELSPSEAA